LEAKKSFVHVKRITSPVKKVLLEVPNSNTKDDIENEAPSNTPSRKSFGGTPSKREITMKKRNSDPRKRDISVPRSFILKPRGKGV
jgi:hypothetical protein